MPFDRITRHPDRLDGQPCIRDLRLTVRGEMELAYQGEITTPSRCGRMDQGCAFGDHAVLMEFDGERLETEELRPPSDLHFVIDDTFDRMDETRALFSRDDVLRDLAQPDAAAELCERVRREDLSVVVFSGFTLEELAARPECGRLLAATDLLIDGRYEQELPDRTRRWIGSTNQAIRLIPDGMLNPIPFTGLVSQAADLVETSSP